MERVRALKVVIPGLLLFASCASAEVLFESATLGTPGIVSGGYSLDGFQFLGTGFTLSKPAKVHAIGGHIGSSGSLFGAIVRLPSAAGLPAFKPADISRNAVASAVFTAPARSAEVVVPLSATLSPGHYGVVFGSGAFGANGSGFMPVPADTGATDHPDTASYFSSTTAIGSTFPRIWESGRFRGARFVVYGEPVPGSPPSPNTKR